MSVVLVRHVIVDNFRTISPALSDLLRGQPRQGYRIWNDVGKDAPRDLLVAFPASQVLFNLSAKESFTEKPIDNGLTSWLRWNPLSMT